LTCARDRSLCQGLVKNTLVETPTMAMSISNGVSGAMDKCQLLEFILETLIR
jgi:hypothetical protein